jgi:hypothetical protein
MQSTQAHSPVVQDLKDTGDQKAAKAVTCRVDLRSAPHSAGLKQPVSAHCRHRCTAATLNAMTLCCRQSVRTWVIAGGILIAGDAISYAQAQNNQPGEWCAYFTGGPTNCGFATFQQCLEAIHGKTGLCDHNPRYVPPASAQPSPGRRH